jgi:hypothetical protein
MAQINVEYQKAESNINLGHYPVRLAETTASLPNG